MPTPGLVPLDGHKKPSWQGQMPPLMQKATSIKKAGRVVPGSQLPVSESPNWPVTEYIQKKPVIKKAVAILVAPR